MIDSAPRRLRADAARNAERIVEAARDAFRELGVDVAMEEIARRAGVGVATLYRRFPNKEGLAHAVLEQCFADDVEPAIQLALADQDAWRGMVTLLEAALTMAARNRHIFAAAGDSDAMATGLAARYFAALGTLVRRAQDAGQVRADLQPDDLPRLVFMLIPTLRFVEQPTEGWRRYLALLLDALRPAAATALPPAPPPIGRLAPDRPPDPPDRPPDPPDHQYDRVSNP